jgi:hypothetical protein
LAYIIRTYYFKENRARTPENGAAIMALSPRYSSLFIIFLSQWRRFAAPVIVYAPAFAPISNLD